MTSELGEINTPVIGDRVVFFDQGFSDCIVTVTVVKVAYPHEDMIVVKHDVGWDRWIFADEIVMTMRQRGGSDA